jgi:valyl-tRNA synthetase
LELSKTFDPKIAGRWYERWVEMGYFIADPARPGPVFSIVIPPPNVTGQLHLGHALNVTLQDIIVRARRMQGYNTLWVPGTDHAGIATQNVVEREIAGEGINRHQMGREAFERRVWQWRETYGSRILHQLRRLGASCDWTRERFTLDEGLSRAVIEVFVRLHEQGLIYRERTLINWCPRCETALSDLEVSHKDADGQLYYIRYPFEDGSGSITVATTRPETMLGDTAVAINPADARYKHLAGKHVRLPLIGRIIPIITDASVDSAFGTGAVKITPAHDFNDFAIGKAHGLEEIATMDGRARMTAAAGPYAGISREECRKAVVRDLEAQGLLEKTEPHRLALAVCSRCDTTLEPMLSTQWFVRIKPLAEKAIAAVRDGRTTFHPKFWENTYFNWMENVHDWCISRQLWWGHRIPAYHCGECGNTMVVARKPAACNRCESTRLVQEEDVLDTWFSSGLWPFSTLGWPEDTPDLRKYYPTSLLVTGFDIIFFWVARMMMLGLEFTGQVPFRDVYITPLVRDQFGKKMTKSRGNVVDPLQIMETYGTDAVRFTLAQLAVQGRDLILDNDRLAASRAFANKIWNAARFVMMNLEGAPQPIEPVPLDKLGLAERWILGRLRDAIAGITAAIDAYEFNAAAARVYHFIWHEFCDWYIELSKEPLGRGGEDQHAARYVLVHCFDQLLRLLHPFMPFISEELWQALRPYIGGQDLSEHLAVAPFPEAAAEDPLSGPERVAMAHCLETTEAINSIRALVGVHPGQRATVLLKPLTDGNDFTREFESWRAYTSVRAKADVTVVTADNGRFREKKVPSAVSWGEVLIEPPPTFDVEKTRAALRKKLDESRGHLHKHQARLNNADFVEKASADTRAEMEERTQELTSQVALLEKQLDQLSDANFS